MLNSKFLRPRSVAVVGASDDLGKPGGKALHNLVASGFSGKIFPVNPKRAQIMGLPCLPSVEALGQVDLAILSVPAAAAVEAAELLCRDKGVAGLVVFSAGFSEDGPVGAALESRLRAIVEAAGASLVGPNCVGFMNPWVSAIFTTPVPKLRPSGVDFASGSGATAVFILEAALPRGLELASLFSVGNAATVGIEEILEHWDEHHEPGISPRVKLIYTESIRDPRKFARHCLSLRQKGAIVLALKAGASRAGGRAAASHTGAMATDDAFVDALLRQQGVLRCRGREELVAAAAVAAHGPLPAGRRVGIVTHAGGPAVLLADALEREGFEVPALPGSPAQQALLAQLFPGSSAENPIDILATGTPEQLALSIDFLRDSPEVDLLAVIFGSPGLVPVNAAYRLLLEKQRQAGKPIYAILPSVVNAAEALDEFREAGGIFFADEVRFAEALGALRRVEAYFPGQDPGTCTRSPQLPASDGFASADEVHGLLEDVGLVVNRPLLLASPEEAEPMLRARGALVLKAQGLLHKSDAGGVALDLRETSAVRAAWERLRALPGCVGVSAEAMLAGTELFVGIKRDRKMGALMLFGLGGIYVEIFRDLRSVLLPTSAAELRHELAQLRGYPVLLGARGKAGIDLDAFIEALLKVQRLCLAHPEIQEMDINPLMATPQGLVVADARLRWKG